VPWRDLPADFSRGNAGGQRQVHDHRGGVQSVVVGRAHCASSLSLSLSLSCSCSVKGANGNIGGTSDRAHRWHLGPGGGRWSERVEVGVVEVAEVELSESNQPSSTSTSRSTPQEDEHDNATTLVRIAPGASPQEFEFRRHALERTLNPLGRDL
jgi:hypothetical protein